MPRQSPVWWSCWCSSRYGIYASGVGEVSQWGGGSHASIVAVAVVSFVVAFGQQMQMKFPAWQFERARIVSELKADGRRHLVIVRYGPKHQPNHEWVYNEADIDGAKVVWAGRWISPRRVDYWNTSRIDRCGWRRLTTTISLRRWCHIPNISLSISCTGCMAEMEGTLLRPSLSSLMR